MWVRCRPAHRCKEVTGTSEQHTTTSRSAAVVEDAAPISVMGLPVLEALPSRSVPYEQVDPYILVHEGRFRPTDAAGIDTKHPHRGFDNLWYAIEGTISTGHSTGRGGSMERVRLAEGDLLFVRTGRGVWHAEAMGGDEVEEDRGDVEFRGVLFWVNLARDDKGAEPFARVLRREEIPNRRENDAIVRILVGDGSPLQLGTPASILDVELPEGGHVTTPLPSEFQGFAYELEGEATFGTNRQRARPPQLVVMGPGDTLAVTDATPGTRFLVMAGRPFREMPVFNGPFVD